MEYKKVDTEMQKFDVDYNPPPKPFDNRDHEKAKHNKAKERRISISLVVLTFISSVCVLFGTLYPELSRGEIDMTPWRELIRGAAQRQTFLIRDKITLVNLGLWRYCYDDQLYDLIEIINPQFNSLGRRRRSAEESEEEHSIEKRQVQREGDISIRCHNVPKPWKMPYHVKNKTEATKVCLIIGVVACVLSFLISILVLITRLPILKFVQLLSCFIGVVAGGVVIGLFVSENMDERNRMEPTMTTYTQFVTRDMMEAFLNDEQAAIWFDWFRRIHPTDRRDIVVVRYGVCFLMICLFTFLSAVNFILAELHRHVSK